MHRVDDSVFLLYIEPNAKDKNKLPINDELTKLMQLAMSESKSGVANYSSLNDKPIFRNGGYKGFHTTSCGKISTNHDYLLKNGMITNSLSVYYLQYYRDVIPKSEMNKVYKLKEYYEKFNR